MAGHRGSRPGPQRDSDEVAPPAEPAGGERCPGPQAPAVAARRPPGHYARPGPGRSAAPQRRGHRSAAHLRPRPPGPAGGGCRGSLVHGPPSTSATACPNCSAVPAPRPPRPHPVPDLLLSPGLGRRRPAADALHAAPDRSGARLRAPAVRPAVPGCYLPLQVAAAPPPSARPPGRDRGSAAGATGLRELPYGSRPRSTRSHGSPLLAAERSVPQSRASSDIRPA